jgi:hypothetical protein
MTRVLLPGSFGPTCSPKSGETWPHPTKPAARSETCPEQDFPLVLASLGPTTVGPNPAGQVEPGLGGKDRRETDLARIRLCSLPEYDEFTTAASRDRSIQAPPLRG